MKTKVKEYRLRRNLTQQQLADLVQVSARTIISLEKEKYKPSLFLAYKLALLFDTSIEELCCMEENMKDEEKKYENLQ
ncbi:transcriptional regulator [Floricoccus tropicus]|uniref:Transcriptional regulator n=1 Tax=Floricoccus tropicus TaxID=1859473 RepID=A0A1E8GMM2_9LACT|nr:helix-turn-helix transcriptional regulator [Floricoccus tropicus]OFI49491.1 transcriptional regulator [Floricoccus tropicus]